MCVDAPMLGAPKATVTGNTSPAPVGLSRIPTTPQASLPVKLK